eukprot:1120508-Pleurochrysis_carterae.AAC.5
MDARSFSVPEYSRLRSHLPAPLECISKPSTPHSASDSAARITTAPAPSPKSTHVLRSPQSTHRESASAPITTA